MKSPLHSYRLSSSLYEASETRWRTLEYKSRSEYIRGLIRNDCLYGCQHQTGLTISRASAAIRDDFDGLLHTWEGRSALRLRWPRCGAGI